MLAGRRPARWLGSAILIGIATARPEAVRAQHMADARVAVGTPLQVSTESGTYQTATFLSDSGSELVVQESCGAGCARMVNIPWTRVTRVDAAIRQHSLRRVVLGGAIGVAYGVALGYAASRFLPCHWNGGRCPGFGAVLFVPGMVSVGGAIGVASGWHSTYERWQRVWPDE
jgi:hypothetical protein